MSQGIHIDAKSDAELHIWPAADTPTQTALHQEEGLQHPSTAHKGNR